MSNTITFARLDQILQSLGFAVTRIPGSHMLYEDAASGALLMLRLFDSEDPVDAGTLAVVRRTLVEKGVLDRARWEDLLGQRSLAG